MSNLIITLLFIMMTLSLIVSLQLQSLSLIIIITLIILIILYIVLERKKSLSINKKVKQNLNTFYFTKDFMTLSELDFYNKIKILENNFKIVPQINLATIIKKISKNRYQNELFRNIDFAIFTKDYSKLLLLIELNDQTHKQDIRKERDLKIKKICKEVGIKLIFFYTTYPNEKEYVINRILTEIEKQYKN